MTCGLVACFFFQAEDGIRDVAVTGVQTCALPISSATARAQTGSTTASETGGKLVAAMRRRPGARPAATANVSAGGGAQRSEERRVGKECRSRGSPEQ